MPEEYVIETFDLTKRYRDKTAVEGLNLSIEEGEIFGLLGPNGAGKTTAVLMLLGLTVPTSGTCRVCGFDPVKEPLKVKLMSGYLPERIGFYQDLTALENLKYIARLNRIPMGEATKRIDEALYKVSLNKDKDLKVGKFSRGMKQRLAVANVLLKKPRVAFLDEPTQGIDPKGIKETLDIFRCLSREEGITLLLSSHLLHQVQEICDRVGIMVGGRMVRSGSIKDFVQEGARKWMIEVEVGSITDELFGEMSDIQGVTNIKREGAYIVAESDRDVRAEISEVIFRSGVHLLGLRAKERSLDEIYMKYFEET